MTFTNHPGRHLMPGITLVGVVAILALYAAETSLARQWGLGALTLAIAFGALLGNTLYPRLADSGDDGVDFAKSRLLRLGVILFGFSITFQQIAAVGWAGLLADVLVLGSTFALALLLGRRLGLDRHTCVLIGAGSAICGAAAVMATATTIRARADQASVAVATVVLFGTLAMVLYPLLSGALGLSETAFGLYAGSTIHEVAQVIVAGSAVGEQAAASAVITKMLRVMLLAPFLLLIGGQANDETGERHKLAALPWFALLFIVAAGINSLGVLPAALVDAMVQLDHVLLTMAMAALGVHTRIATVRRAGLKPVWLAAALFCYLLVGGYAISWMALRLFDS